MTTGGEGKKQKNETIGYLLLLDETHHSGRRKLLRMMLPN